MTNEITSGRDRLPVFRFTKGEEWFPIGVEESLALFNFKYSEGKMRDTKTALSVALSDKGRLNFPAGMKQPDLPPVVYHRIIMGGGLAWHQYWLWYMYNPWGVGGVGKHEGDWEFVQIGVTPDRRASPILMTCSQHHSGGKREYWSVEVDDQENPVVYVALGSHANYFSAGRQGGGIDLCDGRGRELVDYELRDFGDWAEWPGQWGNSTGEGKSPESPGCQIMRWRQPHIYHAQSK